MGATLLVSALALVVQFSSINDLNEYKQMPTKDTSFFIIFVGFLTTGVCWLSFGPPCGPVVVSGITLIAMFFAKLQYPGLIIAFEEMMITGVLFSVSFEYFIVGYFF